MSEKPEALRLADIFQAQADRDYAFIDDFRYSAAAELRSLHAENERLREALAWAYNLRHLRGHSDPVVIPERFAPLIEAALRREEA